MNGEELNYKNFISQVPSHRWLTLTVAAPHAAEDEGVTIRVIPDGTTIRTGSLVGIFCSWTPGSRRYGDFTVNGWSTYSDIQYAPIVEQEDPTLRLFFSSNNMEGFAGFLMKDVSKADARRFSCCVSRLGCSETIYLHIEEGSETTTYPATTKKHTTHRLSTRHTRRSTSTTPTTTAWFMSFDPMTPEEATKDPLTSDNELDLEFGEGGETTAYSTYPATTRKLTSRRLTTRYTRHPKRPAPTTLTPFMTVSITTEEATEDSPTSDN